MRGVEDIQQLALVEPIKEEGDLSLDGIEDLDAESGLSNKMAVTGKGEGTSLF